jgi:hypothetical protein
MFGLMLENKSDTPDVQNATFETSFPIQWIERVQIPHSIHASFVGGIPRSLAICKIENFLTTGSAPEKVHNVQRQAAHYS